MSVVPINQNSPNGMMNSTLFLVLVMSPIDDSMRSFRTTR